MSIELLERWDKVRKCQFTVLKPFKIMLKNGKYKMLQPGQHLPRETIPTEWGLKGLYKMRMIRPVSEQAVA